MTTITPGMTPAQFITAMNNNHAGLATNWGVDANSFITLTTLNATPNQINANLRAPLVSYGQRGSSYISALNSGLASTVHRFQDRIVPSLNLINSTGISVVISDDGSTMILFTPYFKLTTTDGINFTKSDHIGIPGGADSGEVMKIGDLYYLTICLTGASPHYWGAINLFTSSDGHTWADQGVIISYEGAGWESVSAGNSCLWKEGTTWYILYEMKGPADSKGGVFNIGLATAPDVAGLPGTFTKYVGNPVIGNQIGCPINPGKPYLARLNNQVAKFNGRYYMYFHAGYGAGKTYCYRAYSTDLMNWILEGPTLNGRVVPEVGSWAGNYSVDEFKGKTYMFYINNAETGNPDICIDMVVDNRSLTEMIALYP